MDDGGAGSGAPAAWVGAEHCYLTTTGRRTGRPHEIEIWFGVVDGRLYLISGSGRADWLRNAEADPAVRVRVGDDTRAAAARLVANDGAHAARRVIAAKYQGWRQGRPLSDWARTGALLELSFA